jgi:mono/diheme cytochrome c family protein
MPQNFGQTLTPPQLQQLVAYLQSAVGGGGGK